MIGTVVEIIKRHLHVNEQAARDTAQEIASVIFPFFNPSPPPGDWPMNKKIQRLQAPDATLSDEFIFSRQWGLMIRTKDKQIIETRYCASAEDLQVNWLYERLRSASNRLNCFHLTPAGTAADGTEVWKWQPVTTAELRAMIAAAFETDGELTAGPQEQQPEQ